LTLARRAVVEHRLFARGERVLVGCSGGPDSNALLHALALLRARVGHGLVAVGVDHGLRPGAAAELDVAAGVARAEGVPFERAVVAVEPGANLQARAREARHQALQRCASRSDATVVALAHTADDRAETVLLRLLRGAGPRGLAALPPRSRSPTGAGVDVVRPLLRARRSDVLAHLQRHRVPHADDPSNQDARFLRVRVRRELLPLLEELSPGVVGHLCALAEMLDGGDDPLASLGRVQRQELYRLLAKRRGELRLRLAGDRELSLTIRPIGRARGR
jgi:tRNA(Ile)-lysidine synthase